MAKNLVQDEKFGGKPSVKDKNLKKKASDRESKFIDELRTSVTKFDIDGTQTWRDKMITATNMRQGIKRVTQTPYPGAPNIPLPETDKLIRKAKPNLVLAAISGKKLMSVKAMEGAQEVNDEVKGKAEKAEAAMNFIFQKKMDWAKKLTLAADHSLEKGIAEFKVIEKFEKRLISHTFDRDSENEEALEAFKQMDSDQKKATLVQRFGIDPEDKDLLNNIIKEFNSGADIINFSTQGVITFPDVIIPKPEKVYVPKGTRSISKAQRVTHEFFLNEHELWQRALDGIYDKEKIRKNIDGSNQSIKKGDDSLNEQIKDKIAGIDHEVASGDMIRIHETYTWFQPKEDAQFERWVFTFLADVGNADEALIQRIPFPFEFSDLDEDWNWIRHDNEIIDENQYRSRGIPEQIRAIQEFMERSMNSMLIRDTINNNPMYTVLSTSKLMDTKIQFIPGQKLPVGSHDEIKQLTGNVSVDVSSPQIIQTLKAFAEEYLGSSDQLFRNATNRGGGKTLGEIEVGIEVNQFLQNLDVANWLSTLSKVYLMVFNVMKERMTQPLFINGEVITKEDFQFIPDIQANGSIELADKQFQAQKSLARLGIVRQAKADGTATLDDVFNAYEDYLEKDGVMAPDSFITDPKEILTQQITQLEQQAQQLNQVIEQQNEVIDEGEKSLDKVENDLKDKQGDLKNTQKQLDDTVKDAVDIANTL